MSSSQATGRGAGGCGEINHVGMDETQARQIRQSATHSAIPNRAAILESLTHVLPDEHTVAPITAPVEMPAVQAAQEDSPVRLFPRKSSAARMELLFAT